MWVSSLQFAVVPLAASSGVAAWSGQRCELAIKFCSISLLLLLSIGPRWLMPRMYRSHIGLLYYPQTFQISPLVSFYEVLADRGGDVYEPSYFQMFQLSTLVVFKRFQQPNVELHGREMADEFCLKMPDFHVTFRDLLHAVNLRHGTDGFTSPPKEGVLRIFLP